MENNYFIIDFETTGLDYQNDFPIEVGFIVVDHKLNLLDTYQSLIVWPELEMKYKKDFNWEEKYTPAYNVHKIEPADMIRFGKKVYSVKNEIIKYAENYSINNHKPILISDCANFEFNFLNKILPVCDYFHYAVWDTNLLLENTKTAHDPVPAHRALADCGLLYRQLIQAYAENNWLEDDTKRV